MLDRFSLKTSARVEFIDITPRINEIIKHIKAESGICNIFIPHTTAAVTINENADPDVTRDITSFTSKLIPQHGNFRHSEGNSDAHIKSSFFSPSLIVPIESQRLVLGTWQSVYFCEFDGPRTRQVVIKILF